MNETVTEIACSWTENSNIKFICVDSVAEWSKALVLGTSPFEGVGSNPTAVRLFYLQTN